MPAKVNPMPQAELFSIPNKIPTKPELCQFFTPEWAAEEIVGLHLSECQQFGVPEPTIFCEPSCGEAAILKAIPSQFSAFGVEIDPEAIKTARQSTNRPIYQGDFRTIALPENPDGIVGNPPFQTEIFDGFLKRSNELLPEGGIALFLLPAYFFQTSSRATRYNQDWTIQSRLCPRDLFPNLSIPLIVATFLKEKHKRLLGFFLYRETQEIKELNKVLQSLARKTKDKTPCWETIVNFCIQSLGGEANLESIYRIALPKAPPTNKFPKQKIRQTLQRGREKGIFTQNKQGLWGKLPIEI